MVGGILQTLKHPQELIIKLNNFGHHDEFELSGLTVEDIKKKINDKKVFYNHFSDKSNLNKWKNNDSLEDDKSKITT